VSLQRRATQLPGSPEAEQELPAQAWRQMLDPAVMAPGTAMPSGLFRQEGNRWVFAGPTPPGFAQYDRDHAELLVRYIFEFTAEEQRRMPSAPAPVASLQP